ncbi:NADH-quinone oxidoreductase subunit C [Desulfogranum marinum]|uniref:NADH-quinone oxidoreductase subunit C n=1 Tax=Desulfogranum marinum TaxID=453220 RepID=UPI00196694FE|nr:NADH-quinone oxidoreductase subunit C [Desulfogranum marinum]MBM9511301.1 NADH-quinone oxidoreductase subunit C [Desulfogranum marinum]
MNRIEKTQVALAALFPEGENEPETVTPVEGDEAEEAVQTGQRQPGVQPTPYEKHGSHLDVLCENEQVVDIAGVLDKEGFFLETISGVDWLKQEQLEVVYDYTRYDHELCRVTVRTFISRTDPELPTISSVIPGANWHERETFDFYGVNFSGHPDLTRILLPEDADFHPLLKDYMP